MKSPVYIVHEISIWSVHYADNQVCDDECLLYLIWFFYARNVSEPGGTLVHSSLVEYFDVAIWSLRQSIKDEQYSDAIW